MESRFSAIGLTLLAAAGGVLAATPEAAPTLPTSAAPIEFATASNPELNIQATADACYQQSLAPTGSTASCDVLIDLAQSQTIAPALLASAYSSRGLITSRQAAIQGDREALQAALRDHEAAARLAPSRVEPLLNQANLLLRLGRTADALALYDQLVAQAPMAGGRHRSIALFNRAIAYRALGDLGRAQADLQNARNTASAERASNAPVSATLAPVTRQ